MEESLNETAREVVELASFTDSRLWLNPVLFISL
jgi:hypothetical protein